MDQAKRFNMKALSIVHMLNRVLPSALGALAHPERRAGVGMLLP